MFFVFSKRREDWERFVLVRVKEGGYRLRDNVLFYFYVSTSFCGDARFNSFYEIIIDKRKRIFFFFFVSSLDLVLGVRVDFVGVRSGFRGLGL